MGFAWALATAIVALLFTLGSAAVAGSTAVATDAQVSAEAAEQARKAAASFSILTALSLIIGAFIGSVAGGYHRTNLNRPVVAHLEGAVAADNEALT